MQQVIFSTGNEQKLHTGQAICESYGILLIQNDLAVDEIQSEDGTYVAQRKAEAAFELLKQPVLISDDTWQIHGLNDFPGTYAKSVNTWFTTDDYLRLTKDLPDKSVSVVQTLVYQDGVRQHVFAHKTTGILLSQAHESPGSTLQKIVSFDPDGKRSIAEVLAEGSSYSGEGTVQVWHEFAQWFTEKQT